MVEQAFSYLKAVTAEVVVENTAVCLLDADLAGQWRNTAFCLGPVLSSYLGVAAEDFLGMSSWGGLKTKMGFFCMYLHHVCFKELLCHLSMQMS